MGTSFSPSGGLESSRPVTPVKTRVTVDLAGHLAQPVPLKDSCSGEPASALRGVSRACALLPGSGPRATAFQEGQSYPHHAKVGPCRFRPAVSAANDAGSVGTLSRRCPLQAAAQRGPPLLLQMQPPWLQFREDGIY